MTQLIPFSFQSHQLRIVERDGEPWFVAKDVAAILEHSNHRMMLNMLDEDEKGVSIVYTPGGPQEMAIISESGLYHAIFLSRKPQAKAFRRWVTEEVLPAIRKTGGYQMDPDAIAIPKDEYIALLKAKMEILEKRQAIQPGPRAWTAEEDQKLLDLRRQGLGFTRIGYRLGRSSDSCKNRWRRLSRRHAELQGELFARGGAS